MLQACPANQGGLGGFDRCAFGPCPCAAAISVASAKISILLISIQLISNSIYHCGPFLLHILKLFQVFIHFLRFNGFITGQCGPAILLFETSTKPDSINHGRTVDSTNPKYSHMCPSHPRILRREQEMESNGRELQTSNLLSRVRKRKQCGNGDSDPESVEQSLGLIVLGTISHNEWLKGCQSHPGAPWSK